MKNQEKLAAFGANVLEILEKERNWSTDAIGIEIARIAFDMGLARGGADAPENDGYFTANPEPAPAYIQGPRLTAQIERLAELRAKGARNAKERAELERLDAVETLRGWLPPGSKVFSIIRHVSRSGMSRVIDFYTFDGGERLYLSGLMSHAMDIRRNRDGGLKIDGCGMDMCFATVYALGRVLYPDGFTPALCGMHGRNRTPDTEPDTDGGYSLKSEVL
jgi:hypothetical protein